MRAQFLAFAMCALAGQALAQASGDTFADIRQDLSKLRGDMRALNAELQTTRTAWQLPDGAIIDRVTQIEVKLQSLTQSLEQLEFRISQLSSTSESRLAAMDARLCALDPLCDGGTDVGGISGPDGPQSGIVLTVTEQREFDMAKAVLDSGDPASAIELFREFTESYPGGPMTQQAHYLMGEGYVDLEAHRDAARAYLASYSADPKSVLAADALFKLSLSFKQLGRVKEACVTLAEVEFRFPSSAAAAAALAAIEDLGCE